MGIHGLRVYRALAQALAVLFVLSLTGCNGQRDATAFTYRLHKPKNHDQWSTLHNMPDGALLALTKESEQPKQVWHLLRIAAWDTAQPREDELDIDVGPNNEVIGWADQNDRFDRNDQLLMDPGGNYLVVRLSQEQDTTLWKYNFDQSAKPPRTVLNIIDLHGFKLLRRVATTDPVLGGGDMGFSPTRALLVSGIQAKSTGTIDGKVIHTSQYTVESLSLPGLEPETVCRYTIAVRPYSPQTPSTPEEFKRSEEERQEEVQRQQNQHQAAEKACGPKLVPLGFSSLDDLNDNFSFPGLVGYRGGHWRSAVGGTVPPQSPSGCEFWDMSWNLKYELYDCDQTRVQLTFLTWYRGFRVFRLEDGKQVMDLRLPHNFLAPVTLESPQFSGVLATSGEVTYAVLLRDGAELEGYRVP